MSEEASLLSKSYIRIGLPILLLVVSAASAYYVRQYATVEPVSTGAANFTCDYYAAPTGIASNTGTSGSPWDLQTALNNSSVITAGKTLCLKGGTYNNKYVSRLNGGTVRSAPGEWAKIDGFKPFTLTANISATDMVIPVDDASGLPPADQLFEMAFNDEVVRIYGREGNNLTVYSNRGASGSKNGAIPHTAGETLVIGGQMLYVEGDNTTFRDFEIMSSETVRITNDAFSRAHSRGVGVTNVGDSNKFINLIIHDAGVAIFTSSVSSNTEAYGNVMFNNGYMNSTEADSGGGLNFYLENTSGYSRIHNNIGFNAFGLGAQMYGVSGPYVGGDIQDNVIANSGAPTGGIIRTRNVIFGPDQQRIPSITISGNHFYHMPNTNSYNVLVGYGAGVNNATFNNNYIIGGGSSLEIDNTDSISGQGNVIYSLTPDVAGYMKARGLGGTNTWNNNAYYGTTTDQFYYNNVLDFNGWKAASGFDANSTASPSTLPTTVIVKPNIYESGRAHVIIHNASQAGSVNVDLSQTGLTNGQTYEIRNPQNYFGALVGTGTYNASSPTISVTLTGAASTVATPAGRTYTPPSTCPAFCALVVLPTSEEGTPTPAPTISSFTASPATITSGNSSTLSWSVSGATSLSINQGIGTVTGTSRSVSPTTTTTYTLTATNSGGSTTATATVTVNPAGDTTAPTVSITAPANNASVNGTITFSATASDNVGVVGVQFKVDGSNSGSEDTSSPYSINLNTTSLSNGSHSLTATARDAAGNTTTSSVITVTVSNATPDTTAPVVSVTAPANNATVSGNVNMTASASDNIGVVGVQFKVDGSNVGSEDTNSPYSISWDSTTAANGTHTLTAVARDAATNSTTSSAITVAVNNVVPPTQVATPSISPNGGSFSGNQAVTLSTTTPGATIYYTTDGSTPTTSSSVYSSALTLSSTTTVNAIAVKSGMTNSTVSSATFTRSSSSGGGGGGGGGGGSSKPKPNKLNEKDNFICTGNPTVYLYYQGQKEAYSELAVYQAWNGNDFSNIKTITQAECNAIPLRGLVRLPIGTFVKVAGNPTVYKVVGLTVVSPYASYAALQRDLQDKAVYIITIPFLHTHSRGEVIN